MRVLPPLAFVASLMLLVAQPVWAQSDPDRRELEARTSFARGDYDQALSLYVGLYAETLHPTYLRNIGRCYQQLRQPGRAIAAVTAAVAASGGGASDGKIGVLDLRPGGR